MPCQIDLILVNKVANDRFIVDIAVTLETFLNKNQYQILLLKKLHELDFSF